MQKIKVVRVLQTILLLPSTLTTGLMLFVAAFAMATMAPGALLEYFQRLGFSGGVVTSVVLLLSVTFVLTVASGFALLWFLVWNGSIYFAQNRALGVLAICVALVSLIVGYWLTSRLIAKPNSNPLTIILLSGLPVILGAVHTVALIVAVIKGKSQSDPL